MSKAQDISQKNILVTGGAGFIGSNLVLELVRIGAFVRVLDNFSTGKKENLANKISVDFYEGLKRTVKYYEKQLSGVVGTFSK